LSPSAGQGKAFNRRERKENPRSPQRRAAEDIGLEFSVRALRPLRIFFAFSAVKGFSSLRAISIGIAAGWAYLERAWDELAPTVLVQVHLLQDDADLAL
jgi:hypothetical protein